MQTCAMGPSVALLAFVWAGLLYGRGKDFGSSSQSGSPAAWSVWS